MTIEKRTGSDRKLDRGGFEALFREYFPPLISFAMKFLPDEDDAREVVHQVFINLWERREEVDLSIPIKSYLFTSVHNRSLNVIRNRKKFSDGEVPDVAGDWDVEKEIETMELEEKIGEAVDSLPEKCREIFLLNRYEGLRYQEIADQLGISVKTVENQMSKALKILREKLLRYLTILMWLIVHSIN